MKEEVFFTSWNVDDYPDPPPEKPGKEKCAACDRWIYEGEMVIISWEGDVYCEDCIQEMRPDEIYDLIGKEFVPLELIEKLGGKWEEI